MELAGVPPEYQLGEGGVAGREIGSPIAKLKGPKFLRPRGPVKLGIPMPILTSMATMLGAKARA